ncbi:hypothetical protein [Desulfocurvus sp.]|jgi:hypothetical protein|uniref:hypothetical protein n=1 Tax=Desulfocurvus sp. TaxID=2871698 RepID=UPI0025C4DCF9|nr:hypothetical protein [Desulfocurvus sp.]MCK9241316.1 hypothetical protein [Desulfocurvus sp.]
MKSVLKPFVLCAVAVALLACAGCAPRAMSLPEARGLCFTYSTGGGRSPQNPDGGGGSCGEMTAICEAFLDVGRLTPLDREACLADCAATRRELYMRHMADGCWVNAKRASDLCQRYCRGLED